MTDTHEPKYSNRDLLHTVGVQLTTPPEGEGEPWPDFVSLVLDMAANSYETNLVEQGRAITQTEEWLRARLSSEGEPDGIIREHARTDKLAAAMIAERDGGEDSYISPDLTLECSRCGHTRWLVLGREP